MAAAPHAPKPAPTPDPAAVEKKFLDVVGDVEHSVDSWLSDKDRSQPQAVTLPRVKLDAEHAAEIERRYLAAGWGKATIDAGVLHLAPTAEG